MGTYEELANLEGQTPIQIGVKKRPDQKSTLNTTQPREVSRDQSRESKREKSRDLPTRDEIQEFNFHLRDDLKVKVQAEVPHPWQRELEEIARKLNVKKLELYRFIIGEFLGKVRRKSQINPTYAKTGGH